MKTTRRGFWAFVMGVFGVATTPKIVKADKGFYTYDKEVVVHAARQFSMPVDSVIVSIPNTECLSVGQHVSINEQGKLVPYDGSNFPCGIVYSLGNNNAAVVLNKFVGVHCNGSDIQ